jgi:hypothetical protein
MSYSKIPFEASGTTVELEKGIKAEDNAAQITVDVKVEKITPGDPPSWVTVKTFPTITGVEIDADETKGMTEIYGYPLTYDIAEQAIFRWHVVAVEETKAVGIMKERFYDFFTSIPNLPSLKLE